MATDTVGIRIRGARREQADALTRIAFAAKRSWGYPEDLIAVWEQALTVTPTFLQENPTFVAEVGGRCVGFVGCSLRSSPTLEIIHFWVLPEHMNRGVGRQLWNRVVSLCREQNCTRIELDSDPYARGFYETCGARAIGEVPSIPRGRLLPRMRYDLARRPS